MLLLSNHHSILHLSVHMYDPIWDAAIKNEAEGHTYVPTDAKSVSYTHLFQSDVTMYGEEQEDFGSDHYWNAVKVDGQWFYVDPCYTDVYTEVMSRDRVETDGDMNHTYFLFSDTSARKLYDGNFSSLRSLYENEATHKTYETRCV